MDAFVRGDKVVIPQGQEVTSGITLVHMHQVVIFGKPCDQAFTRHPINKRRGDYSAECSFIDIVSLC